MQTWPLVASLITIAITAQRLSAQTPPLPDPPKFARISGTVLDGQDAQPLNHAVVCFVLDRNGYYDGTNDYCGETDERGSFHVADLPTGRYGYNVKRTGYIAAEPVTDNLTGVISLSAGDELHEIKFRMQRAGVITGRVVYADGEPFSGAELIAHRGVSDEGRTTTNDLGEYRIANLLPGDYSVHIQTPNQTGDCAQLTNRKTRLYVAESEGRELPSVHIALGQQVSYPDLVMVQLTPHRVSGRVIWDTYPLPGYWIVNLGPRGGMRANNSDGSFSFCGVPPGEFAVRASAKVLGRTFAGEAQITVADEDIKGVEVNPEPSGSIRARIEVEDNVPLDLSRIQIIPFSGAPFLHNSVPQPRREPDGTFIIDEVYTADYRFSLSPLPTGSYLKSVRLGGQEFIDAPVSIHSGETIDDLVLTVSTKAATIAGVVKDEAGNAVPDAHVMLRPDPPHIDPDIHGCFQDSDQNGGFVCLSLAPGKYRVAAWPKDNADWQNMQEIVRSSGVRVDAPESGEVSVIVPLIKP